MRIVLPCSVFVLLFLVAVHSVQGQQVVGERDTVKVDAVNAPPPESTTPINSYAQRYNPRKSMLYAAVLPGSGQIYNKKYWKLPIVYGGFAFLIYQVSFYQQQNLEFRADLFAVINDPTATNANGYTETQLRSLVDESRRERDYFLVLTGLWYILQLVDAHVDSHLKEFEINPKLKVSVEPHIERNGMLGRSNGMRLLIKF